MLDPIGIKPGTVVDRCPVAVGASRAAAPAAPVTGAADPASSASAGRLQQAMAAAAPVDAERVARIRKAIEQGRFPLVPSTIADRLLALKLQWNPNAAA